MRSTLSDDLLLDAERGAARPRQSTESLAPICGPKRASTRDDCLIGLVPGEGIGPELTRVAREVLEAIDACSDKRFAFEHGGLIGADAVRASGTALTEEVHAFFQDVFTRGGAVLCGPGGQRFVYDLRRELDLYCKISPIKVDDELIAISRLRPELVRGLDLLVIRDNAGGIYQGTWRVGRDADGLRYAEHAFSYRERDIRRIVTVAAELASRRSRRLSVIAKNGGVPTITDLWREVSDEVAREHGVEVELVDADLAAYQLMYEPRVFDVVVCPNMLGDILGDMMAVALGSRGLSYSGNFTPDGAAVYQTNHGSAYDLVGTDRANPVAHLYALAMMLRESFGLLDEADWIVDAIKSVWRSGRKTADIAGPGDIVVGLSELGARVADAIPQVARST